MSENKITDSDGNEFNSIQEAIEHMDNEIAALSYDTETLRKLVDSLRSIKDSQETLTRDFKEGYGVRNKKASEEALESQYERASEQILNTFSVKPEFTGEAARFFSEDALRVERVKKFVEKLKKTESEKEEDDIDPLAEIIGGTYGTRNHPIYNNQEDNLFNDDFSIRPEVLDNLQPATPVKLPPSSGERPDYTSDLDNEEKSRRREVSFTGGTHGSGDWNARGKRGLAIPGDSVVGTETWAELVREKNPNLRPGDVEYQFAHLRKPEYIVLRENLAPSRDIFKARVQHELDIRRKAFEIDPKIAIKDIGRDLVYRAGVSTEKSRTQLKAKARVIDRKYHVRTASLIGFASGFAYLLYRELR